jgi:diguanylate cyclase (GGDEF)-like protein
MAGMTLGTVEDQIEKGFPLLRFTPEIERRFRDAFAENRVRLAWIWGLIATLIYDLVYFGDRTMMADVFDALCVVRFLIFTPSVLLCVLVVRRWPSAIVYDTLAVAICVLGVTLPMAVALESASPYLYVYQNGNSAAFLFFVISLRPRFPAVLVGLVLMCASHFTTTALTGAFDAVTYSGIVTFYVTLAIFLAVSAYFLERTDRQNFLNQLRSTLLHAQLLEKSERDELTGLLNRHSLARVRELLWNRSARHGSVAAILLDIDHFKSFNDVHGHLEGDACLRAISGCVAREADAGAHVFRFGGEEILILVLDAEALGALALAERIRAAIEALDIRHRGLPEGCVTASIGVAIGRPRDETLEEILSHADTALYNAKGRGRNTVSMSSAAAFANVA